MRPLSMLEKEINKIIQKDYKKIFGENSYFLFLYHKTNQSKDNTYTFSNFVKEQKDKIKDELEYFYSKLDNKIKLIQTLYYEITSSNKENERNEYNKEFLESIPSNYIEMNRIEKENSIIYKFSFSFPLIEETFYEFNQINKFFIDISFPEFFNLHPAAFL